jgi:hypothetical protein
LSTSASLVKIAAVTRMQAPLATPEHGLQPLERRLGTGTPNFAMAFRQTGLPPFSARKQIC